MSALSSCHERCEGGNLFGLVHTGSFVEEKLGRWKREGGGGGGGSGRVGKRGKRKGREEGRRRQGTRGRERREIKEGEQKREKKRVKRGVYTRTRNMGNESQSTTAILRTHGVVN